MSLLILFFSCAAAPLADNSETGSLTGESTPDSFSKEESDCTGAASSAAVLQARLIGMWTGTAYSTESEQEVTFLFGDDGSFWYENPADAVWGEPYSGGVSYQVVNPHLVRVTANEGDYLEVRHLMSVFLDDECRLSFASSGNTIFSDGVESTFELELAQ